MKAPHFTQFFAKELSNDRKLRRFSPQQKWAWVVLLCLASESKQRGYILGEDEDDLADFCDFDSAQDYLYFIDKLRQKGMVEPVEGGLRIIHWEDRQYTKPSDKPEATKKRKQNQRDREKELATQMSRDVTRDTSGTKKGLGVMSRHTDTESELQIQNQNLNTPPTPLIQNRVEQKGGSVDEFGLAPESQPPVQHRMGFQVESQQRSLAEMGGAEAVHAAECFAADPRWTQYPWGFNHSPDSGFLGFVASQHLAGTTAFQGRTPSPLDAKSWINKGTLNPGRLMDVGIKWDAYQEALRSGGTVSTDPKDIDWSHDPRGPTWGRELGGYLRKGDRAHLEWLFDSPTDRDPNPAKQAFYAWYTQNRSQHRGAA